MIDRDMTFILSLNHCVDCSLSVLSVFIFIFIVFLRTWRINDISAIYFSPPHAATVVGDEGVIWHASHSLNVVCRRSDG